MRVQTLIGMSIATAILGLTTWSSTAFAGKLDGKTVERELEHISADGRIFREIDEGKDEKGRQYKNQLVFERP
jgi:hypothetical protein